jgi:hypothetical protein
MVSPVIVPVAPFTVAVHVEVPPTSTRNGVQLTEVVVVASTVKLALPELAALLASPGYDAWMITGPDEPPVTVTEQPFPDSVQIAGEGNEMLPAPPVGDTVIVWKKVIVSPEIDVAAPDTVAVHWEVASTMKEAGAHETKVVVGEEGEYTNVVVDIADSPCPPHVAFTR